MERCQSGEARIGRLVSGRRGSAEPGGWHRCAGASVGVGVLGVTIGAGAGLMARAGGRRPTPTERGGARGACRRPPSCALGITGPVGSPVGSFRGRVKW